MNQHIHYTVGDEKRVTSLRKMALELELLACPHWITPRKSNIEAAITKEQAEIKAAQRPPSKLKRRK